MPHMDPLRDVVFRSCAVVGSSGILARYEQGAAIDAHDAVMRFNNAPTVGFQKNVGRRCVCGWVSAGSGVCPPHAAGGGNRT
jgi:hypothetical protein